jgi:hypothetical protein
MSNNQQSSTGFKDLLFSVMKRRWFITAIVLFTFFGTILAIFTAIIVKTPMSGEWKELLLLLLGAFIGSYGKIIDYWFSDQDKDKMLVQKMDEEDGVSLSSTLGGEPVNAPVSTIQPQVSIPSITPTQVNTSVDVITKPANGIEIDEDGDGIADGIDNDGDGIIDEYFDHRNCHHVWGDSDHDGHEECLLCGLLKENIEQ